MNTQDRFTEEAHEIEDAGYFGKYFHVMLHMEDDDLNPYQYRLLGHYRRVCGSARGGKCWQSVRTIAKVTQMSISTVSEVRRELEQMGYITCTQSKVGTIAVALVDRMAENIMRFAVPREDCSHSEQGVRTANTSVRTANERKTLEEQPDKKERGAQSPRALFATLSQVIPGQRRPRGEDERTSWSLSDPDLPDICKALWRVFSPVNAKLKLTAKQKDELEAEVITPASDRPFASPSEMYSAYPAAFEEFLVKLKDWMVKQRDVPINMGNIVKFVRGYHFKGIGWFNHMPQSAKQTVADAPASGNLDALQEFISG